MQNQTKRHIGRSSCLNELSAQLGSRLENERKVKVLAKGQGFEKVKIISCQEEEEEEEEEKG